MSDLGEGSKFTDPRLVGVDRQEQVMDARRERVAEVAQARGFEAEAERPGLVARLRRRLSGAGEPAEAEPDETQVWERERQRREEYERDRPV